MRILKIHNYYKQPGGEDSVFHTERAILLARGHEVVEYLESNEKIEAMNKVSIALQTIWSQNSYQKVIDFLLETKPDIAHFHNTFPLISPSAYYACQSLRIPVVQTLDNQRLICPAASFYRDGKTCLDCLGKTPPWPGVLHACYHNSHLHTAVVASMLTIHRWLRTWQLKIDSFLCSTNFYKDLFIKAGLPENKITVVPHFLQDDIQPRSPKTIGNYTLFVGRLDPEKGVKTLLEAWRHLNISLKIRGSGQLEREARDYTSKYGMNQVEFLGRMDKEELSDLIKNARFLIMPSEGYYETFGMVIIEAYARGVPVLASNSGVVPELVADRQTGLLFEPGNASDLAEKASWLWGHTEEARSMGDRSYLEYKKKYTADVGYQKLHDVYARVLESRNA